jgi:hypothetical protein
MSRSKKGLSKRMLSRFKWLRPGVLAMRRQSWGAGELIKLEAVRIAFQELTLDPKNENDWKLLAATLAISQFNEGAGRRTSWTLDRQIELSVLIIERLAENPSLSVKQACALIAKDKKSPEYIRESKPGGLYKAYERARKQPGLLREVVASAPAINLADKIVTRLPLFVITAALFWE